MTPIVHTIARKALVIVLLGSAGYVTLAQASPAASAAKAKELAIVMKAKKVEAFAMRDPAGSNRFTAVLLVPDVQILLVSAAYSRPTDIEYRLYQKEYATAFRDLKAGALASEAFFVEDMLGDGLVAVPVKNALPDAAVVGTTEYIFGGPADPKKRNDKRMAADAYAKAFGDTDQRYTQLLDAFIAELKKAGTLVPAGLLR